MNIIHNEFLTVNKKGRGRIKVISTSKIKKITATKKKRIEKDNRLEVLMSNPHSKGDGFSRSRTIFFAKKVFKKIKIIDNLRADKNIKVIIIVRAMNFKIGSFTYFLY